MDVRSFLGFMFRNLEFPLKLPPGKLQMPNGSARDPFKEASSYSQRLRLLGGLGVQLLGLGNNGHVGFNEPPCGPDSACRVVTLTSSTRQQNAYAFGDEIACVPKQAITLGFREILLSEEIHLIVTGSAKASILEALINSSCSDQLPASWLRRHQRVFLWADQDAVKGLRLS